MKLKSKLNHVLALALVTFAPILAIAQDPPAPADGGGEPQDVPFDSNMTMLFLALGLLFAGLVVYKLNSKKKATA